MPGISSWKPYAPQGVKGFDDGSGDRGGHRGSGSFATSRETARQCDPVCFLMLSAWEGHCTERSREQQVDKWQSRTSTL